VIRKLVGAGPASECQSVMRQEADPTRVLDYALPRPRFRFRIHLRTAIVASLIVLTLNVWPHFVTTVTPNMADVPEPELGWPGLTKGTG